MLRNIDVLEKIYEKANDFLVLADEISVELEIEETNLTELIADEDKDVMAMLEAAESIEMLLAQLTEDLRNSLDYEEFDCDSYSWCLSKVRHFTVEIENYFEPIWDALQSLKNAVQMILSGNRILMQYVHEEKIKNPVLS